MTHIVRQMASYVPNQAIIFEDLVSRNTRMHCHERCDERVSVAFLNVFELAIDSVLNFVHALIKY